MGIIPAADMGAIMTNIASLTPGYLDNSLEVAVELGVQAPQPVSKPPQPITNVRSQKVRAPAQVEVATTLNVSKVGNSVCCACFGHTSHSCVQCCLPCHNPANSCLDDLEKNFL